MRTSHVTLRVSNLAPSLAFYRAVGYTLTRTVEGTPFGNVTMLQLPGDPFVTIELVRNPAKEKVELGTGISHLVIQAESLDAALTDLPLRVLRPIRLPTLTTRTDRGPAGSPTPTVTESNWSSGRPATPTASPRPASPSRRTPLACQPLLDAALLLEHDGYPVGNKRWLGVSHDLSLVRCGRLAACDRTSSFAAASVSGHRTGLSICSASYGMCGFRWVVRPVAGRWLFRSPGCGRLGRGCGSSRVPAPADANADERAEGAALSAGARAPLA